jgi:hypothetical protein
LGTLGLISAPYYRDDNSLYNIEKLLSKLDLPELEDYDWETTNFEENFLKVLNEHLGFTDIFLDVNGYISLGSLKDEQSCPFYHMFNYSEVDYYFKHDNGLLIMIMFVFLKNHGFLNDIARGCEDQLQDICESETEYYCERDTCSEIGDDEPIDPRMILDLKNFSMSWSVAQRRMERLYIYLYTDIDLKEICALMESFEPFNKSIGSLCSALCSLQDFVVMYNRDIVDITDEETLCDLIVWYGNDRQTDYDNESINERYGNDGLFINYLKGDGPNTVNEGLVDIWRESKKKDFPTNLIGTYDELIKTITNEQSFEAFAGLCHKSDFLAALYRKLDGMPGGNKGGHNKWETVGLCTDFFQLLKAAHRHHLSGQKDQV